MLSLKEIKYFSENDKIILESISFNANFGKIYGLVGPSGAGKTTILKCISGLINPNYGEIIFKNTSFLPTPVINRPVSFMQQSFPLYSSFTVYENISVAFESNIKIEKEDQDKKIKETLNIVGISSELWNRKANHLSGGEAQRVALAKCLLKKCEILLLDEPFSNIDKNLKRKLNKYVRDLVKINNLICIYVSHDENDLLLMSDEIIYVENGNILQKGKPIELILKPKYSKIISFGSKIGAQFLSRSVIDQLGLNSNFKNQLKNSWKKIGWRPEYAKLYYKQSQIDFNDNSNKLVIPVIIEEVSDFGNEIVCLLRIISEYSIEYLWHIEYLVGDDSKEIGKGLKANLAMDIKNIFFINDNEEVI